MDVQISFRIREKLKKAVEKYISSSKSLYITPSEFYRSAIREKLKAEAPEIYNELIKVEF